jgi:endogenous inhibitor of DNA gyrase (YacG/DUF329 family)
MSTQTTTGRCAACGHPFTTAVHQRPRRRFCSERCRKSDWARHRHTPRRHRADDITHRRHDVDDPVHDVDDVEDVMAPPGAGAPHCPHCARPIAVITLLVAPAAAQVPVPGAGHG